MAEIIKTQDTRREFIDTLITLAEKDDKIVLIIPDVGFNYIEEYQKKFPERFFNFGVTEQGAMTVATGLALSGFKPYVYSMINFVTFRTHEVIRNAICMHKANVKIIGVKGSEKYKFLGFSHNLLWETEEIDFLEKLPGMKCYLPKNNEEVRKVILETYKLKNPCYIRL